MTYPQKNIKYIQQIPFRYRNFSNVTNIDFRETLLQLPKSGIGFLTGLIEGFYTRASDRHALATIGARASKNLKREKNYSARQMSRMASAMSSSKFVLREQQYYKAYNTFALHPVFFKKKSIAFMRKHFKELYLVIITLIEYLRKKMACNTYREMKNYLGEKFHVLFRRIFGPSRAEAMRMNPQRSIAPPSAYEICMQSDRNPDFGERPQSVQTQAGCFDLFGKQVSLFVVKKRGLGSYYCNLIQGTKPSDLSLAGMAKQCGSDSTGNKHGIFGCYEAKGEQQRDQQHKDLKTTTTKQNNRLIQSQLKKKGSTLKAVVEQYFNENDFTTENRTALQKYHPQLVEKAVRVALEKNPDYPYNFVLKVCENLNPTFKPKKEERQRDPERTAYNNKIRQHPPQPFRSKNIQENLQRFSDWEDEHGQEYAEYLNVSLEQLRIKFVNKLTKMNEQLKELNQEQFERDKKKFQEQFAWLNPNKANEPEISTTSKEDANANVTHQEPQVIAMAGQQKSIYGQCNKESLGQSEAPEESYNSLPFELL